MCLQSSWYDDDCDEIILMHHAVKNINVVIKRDLLEFMLCLTVVSANL